MSDEVLFGQVIVRLARTGKLCPMPCVLDPDGKIFLQGFFEPIDGDFDGKGNQVYRWLNESPGAQPQGVE
jgi:hypothetical protein